jgi:hypothetical protein
VRGAREQKKQKMQVSYSERTRNSVAVRTMYCTTENSKNKQGLVGGKKLAPIAYRLPVGAKTKTLNTYRILVGGIR